MADGTGAAIKVRTYADADLEALRVAITDAEVVQGIGRVRAINRTAETPVDVFLMADVVVPLPVHQIVRWDDVRLDVIRRMWARGAILTSPSDAAKGYPDLFPTVEAAKKAMQRTAGSGEGFRGHLPRNLSILGECPRNRLVAVTYRPFGRGQQTRTAWVTAARAGRVPRVADGAAGRSSDLRRGRNARPAAERAVGRTVETVATPTRADRTGTGLERPAAYLGGRSWLAPRRRRARPGRS